MEFIQVMEGITLVVTLLMFSTGIVPCRNMYKTRSTRNVPYHMFVMGALGCLGMFHYGLMVNNGVLIFLNGVGAVLQILYASLYLSVVRSKTKPLLYLFFAILYICALYTYLYKYVFEANERADVLGMCSSLVTTCIMVLPAFEVIHNIRHKNADGMPTIMLLGGITCSSSWLIYGGMLGDPNIYTPNIPGIFISAVKLYLISLYGKASRDEKHRETNDKDD